MSGACGVCSCGSDTFVARSPPVAVRLGLEDCVGHWWSARALAQSRSRGRAVSSGLFADAPAHSRPV